MGWAVCVCVCVREGGGLVAHKTRLTTPSDKSFERQPCATLARPRDRSSARYDCPLRVGQ